METVVSMSFSHVENHMYLLVLYRNNELRLWSVDTLQTSASINCGDNQETQGRKSKINNYRINSVDCSSHISAQNSLMRKIDDRNFCIFVSHEKFAEFICLSVVNNLSDTNTKTVGLVVQHRVPATQMDLSDFDATATHIWTLWSNAKGDFNISAIFLGTDKTIKWVTAALEPPPDRYSLSIEQGVDPREAYCTYIFHPGRFDRNVIAKALYVGIIEDSS